MLTFANLQIAFVSSSSTDLDDPAGEHHPEEEPPDEEHGDGVLAAAGLLAPAPPGGRQHGQQPRLQQQDVPLEVEEGPAHLNTPEISGTGGLLLTNIPL